MDADGSAPRNLTQHPAKDVRPAWSPDGRRIAFVSSRDGQIRDLRHERRRKWEAGSHTGIGRTTTLQPGHPTGGGSRSCARPPPQPHGALERLRMPTVLPDRFYSYALCRERRRQRAAEADAEPDGAVPGQLVWSPDGRTIYSGPYVVKAAGAERGGSRTSR